MTEESNPMSAAREQFEGAPDTRITAPDLAAIVARVRELEGKATKGPWVADYDGDWSVWTNAPYKDYPNGRAFTDGSAGGEYSPTCTLETRDFIIILRNNILPILGELERLGRELTIVQFERQRDVLSRHEALDRALAAESRLAALTEELKEERAQRRLSDELSESYANANAALEADLERARGALRDHASSVNLLVANPSYGHATRQREFLQRTHAEALDAALAALPSSRAEEGKS